MNTTIHPHVQTVQQVYSLGHAAIERMQQAPGKHALGVVSKLASEKGISEPVLRKAIKFAQTYSREELDAFCSLRTAEGMPLTISVIYQLMYLANKKSRQAVARLAAAQGWSAREVAAEVKRRSKPSHSSGKGGRPPRTPISREMCLSQLVEKCDSWQRWIDRLESTSEAGSSFSIAKLPKPIQQAIEQVSLAMRTLSTKVKKAW